MKLDFLDPAKIEFVETVKFYNLQCVGLGFDSWGKLRKRGKKNAGLLRLAEPVFVFNYAVTGWGSALPGFSTLFQLVS